MNNPASVGGSEGVRCSVAGHENEKIISFCLTNNCWTPLCKECIQMHREYHEEANETVDLKPFLLAREETEKGIQKNLSQAEERINEIQKIILGDINQINQDLESLSKSRALLLSLVNDYFNAVENEYKHLVVDKYRKKESLAQKTMGELSSIKNKLNEHIKKIRVPDLCLGIIENAHLSNYTLDIEKTFKSFLDVELEEKKCQVRVCSEMIPNLRNKMKEYIKIEQNSSIYLSFGNSIRSPEDQQAFLKKTQTVENQLIFNSPLPEPETNLKNDSPSIKLTEAVTATETGTGTGTSKLLAKSAEPEELEKSTYSAEWVIEKFISFIANQQPRIRH